MSLLEETLDVLKEISGAELSLREELTASKGAKLAEVIGELENLRGYYDFDEDLVTFKLPFNGGFLYVRTSWAGKVLKFGRTVSDLAVKDYSKDSCELNASPGQMLTVRRAVSLLKAVATSKAFEAISSEQGFKKLYRLHEAVSNARDEAKNAHD